MLLKSPQPPEKYRSQTIAGKKFYAYFCRVMGATALTAAKYHQELQVLRLVKINLEYLLVVRGDALKSILPDGTLTNA